MTLLSGKMDPVTMCPPSAATARHITAPSCALKLSLCFPSAVSNNLTVPSDKPAKRVVPSGLKRSLTPSDATAIVYRSAPLEVSYMATSTVP